MSDGVNKAVNIKYNLDVNSIVVNSNVAAQATASLSSSLQKEFKSMEGSVGNSLTAIAGEVGALDKEMNRLGRAVSRGMGPEQEQSLNALKTKLTEITGIIQRTAPANFMEELSAEAVTARANLSHLASMMAQIQNMNTQIGQQKGIREMYAYNNQAVAPNDPRYLAALQGDRFAPTPQMLSGSGPRASDALLMIRESANEQKQARIAQREEDRFYAQLQRDEDRRKRVEEREWNRYVASEEKAMAKSETDRMRQSIANAGYGDDEVFQSLRNATIPYNASGIDPDLARTIRQAEDREYRRTRGAELDQSFNRHYDYQMLVSNRDSKEWARNNQPIVDDPISYGHQINPESIIDVKYKQLMENERERARQRNQDEATEFENRRRMKEQFERNMRTGSYDSYVPLPTGFDNSAVISQNQQKRRGIGGEVDYERNGRRAFIGQQIAFGIDDMTQQFMWSNSTAGGVAAAARAGGNNMTAALGATGMSAGPMIGAMLGVQGLAMATSMYFKYMEETEKARVSTEKLETAIKSVHEASSREVTFKYSMVDKDSKSLRKDAIEAERDKEIREKGKLGLAAEEYGKALEREEELKERKAALELEARDKRTFDAATGTIVEDEVTRSKIFDVDRELAVIAEKKKTLAPDSEMFYREEARYEEEKKRRADEIKKKEASELKTEAYEKRKEARNERSNRAVDNFYKNIADEEMATGVKLTGEEVRRRFDTFVEENPQYNLKNAKREIDGKVTDQDRMRDRTIYDQTLKANEEQDDYAFEKKYRNRIFGSQAVELQKGIKRIDEQYGMLSPEERSRMKSDLVNKAEFEVGRQSEAYDKSMRSSYSALSGFTAGSEQEAQLRAKLTVDSDLKSEAEKQTKVLEEIAKNTRTRKPPVPVVRF